MKKKQKNKGSKKASRSKKELQAMQAAQEAENTDQDTQMAAYSGPIASAMTMLTQAHSTGLMFENAVHQQANSSILNLGQTTQGITQIFSSDTIDLATALKDILKQYDDDYDKDH